MSTPSITAAQVAAATAALLGACVVLFKLDVSDVEQAKIVGAIVVLFAAGQQIADAVIRHGRAHAQAAAHHLAAAQVAVQDAKDTAA